MSTTDTLLFGIADQVATITLNRPEHLNALTPAMVAELPRLLARSVEEGARCIVVTGAGRAFCSGAGLSGGDAEPGRDLGDSVATLYNPLARAFAASPVPIITAVNGPAAGAGASIALWGDLIVAARSAYILFAFANIGLVPDAGATWLAAKSVGRVRALEMALLGERLSAEDALTAGLVTRVADDADLMAEVGRLAATVAARPTLAMGMIRRQIATALDNGLEATLADEAEHQRRAGRSRDFAEGVQAFRDKRAATFTGE